MMDESKPAFGSCGDIVALFLIVAYALAAYRGVVDISAVGASLDSDLGIYAAASALEDLPSHFLHDPMTVANPHSFGNAERLLGQWLAPDGEYGLGLLRVGGLTVALFYLGWYVLGRWLFGSPGLAGICSILMGISCWVGWGTFWGVVNSDPVPRVLFAALFPFLLLGGIAALARPWARPLVMLAAGLGVWVHNISALATGAMFFMAFALHRKPLSWRRHSVVLVMCLVAFFVPVLLAIAPLLTQGQALSPEDMEVFRALFHIRFGSIYGNLTDGLKDYLWQYTVLIPLFPLACIGGGLAISRRFGTGGRVRALAAMYPGMLVALCCITLVSVMEFRWAGDMGRLPLGQDLIRGTRFLIPLAWLMIVAGLACFWARIRTVFRVLAVGLLAVVVLLVNEGSWNMGAQYSLREAGIVLPVQEKAAALQHTNELRREALEALRALTRPGDVIMSDSGEPAIRHVALRGLFYSFKDGLYPYYAKNIQSARRWLQLTTAMRRHETAYISIWQEAGVPWLLCSRPQDRERLAACGEVVWSNAGWLVVRRQEAR